MFKIHACVCVCVLHVHYEAKLYCKCVSLYTFLWADRWENHRGIQHVWAFRGEGGQQPATPLFDFWTLMWCHSPSCSPLVRPGSSLGKGLRMKGPEMPSQYTISANEHFVMFFFFFFLNWRYFFLLISSIWASQHQGEIQGCSPWDSLTLPPTLFLILSGCAWFIHPAYLPVLFLYFFIFLSVLGWNCHSRVILWVPLAGRASVRACVCVCV